MSGSYRALLQIGGDNLMSAALMLMLLGAMVAAIAPPLPAVPSPRVSPR